MKKMALTIIVTLIIVSTLKNCNMDSYVKYENYTEEEIIKLADNYMITEVEPGIYDYKIIKTSTLEVCTFSWNVCHDYTKVKGAKEYTVEVTYKSLGIPESQVIVKDRYMRNGKLVTPNVYSENAKQNHDYYKRYKNFISLFGKYNSIKYHLLDDIDSETVKIIQNGYIYSTNTKELEDFLKTITKRQYEYYWDFIITNDINEYNRLVNSKKSFDDILNEYYVSNTVYQVDLSSFENNSKAIIKNTSQGSSTCVNSVLTKKGS